MGKVLLETYFICFTLIFGYPDV